MGKRKKKSKSIWSRLRENPEAMTDIMKGFGGLYAGSQGMVWDPETNKWKKHKPGSEP